MEFLDEFYQLLGYVHIRKLVQVANPSNGDLAGAFLSYIQLAWSLHSWLASAVAIFHPAD